MDCCQRLPIGSYYEKGNEIEKNIDAEIMKLMDIIMKIESEKNNSSLSHPLIRRSPDHSFGLNPSALKNNRKIAEESDQKKAGCPHNDLLSNRGL